MRELFKMFYLYFSKDEEIIIKEAEVFGFGMPQLVESECPFCGLEIKIEII